MQAATSDLSRATSIFPRASIVASASRAFISGERARLSISDPTSSHRPVTLSYAWR